MAVIITAYGGPWLPSNDKDKYVFLITNTEINPGKIDCSVKNKGIARSK